MSDVTMKDILSKMAKEMTGPDLEGPWVVMIADSDGMVLSSWESPGNKINPETFGQFVQLINYANSAFNKVSSVGFSKIDDFTVATPFTYMVIKPIAGGACFIFISAPKSVPLGVIRMSLTNFAPRVELSLPGHEASFETDGNGVGTMVSESQKY